MGAFLYGISLQFKMDIRSRSLLVTCYLVPLLFFAVMGGIFTSIMPGSEKTLIQSMTVMGVSMGALIGVPPSLAEIYGDRCEKNVSGKRGASVVRSHYADCVSLHPPFDHERDYPGCGAGHVSRRGSIRTAALLCEIVTVYHCFSWNCRRAGNAGKEPGKADDAVSGRVSAVDPAVRDHVSVQACLPGILEKLGKLFPAAWGYLLLTENETGMGEVFPLGIIFGAAVLACAILIRRMGGTFSR